MEIRRRSLYLSSVRCSMKGSANEPWFTLKWAKVYLHDSLAHFFDNQKAVCVLSLYGLSLPRRYEPLPLCA